MPSYLIKDLRLFPFYLSGGEGWGGSMVAVSTVKLDRSEKQLDFTSAVKVQVCVHVCVCVS